MGIRPAASVLFAVDPELFLAHILEKGQKGERGGRDEERKEGNERKEEKKQNETKETKRKRDLGSNQPNQ